MEKTLGRVGMAEEEEEERLATEYGPPIPFHFTPSPEQLLQKKKKKKKKKKEHDTTVAKRIREQVEQEMKRGKKYPRWLRNNPEYARFTGMSKKALDKFLNYETASRLLLQKELQKGHLKTKEDRDERARTIRDQISSRLLDSRTVPTNTAELLQRSADTRARATEKIAEIKEGLKRDTEEHERRTGSAKPTQQQRRRENIDYLASHQKGKVKDNDDDDDDGETMRGLFSDYSDSIYSDDDEPEDSDITFRQHHDKSLSEQLKEEIKKKN